MESERIVVQSPMSYSGSARRIWRLTHDKPALLRWLALIPLAALLVAGAWVVVTVWYALFSLLLVPWRLIRRGSRKRKRDEVRHRETLRDQGT